MAVDYQYIRSNTGPQAQVSGSDVARFPTWNFGSGIKVTPRPSYPRLDIELDNDTIGDSVVLPITRQGNYLCRGAGSLVHLTGSTGDVVYARARDTDDDQTDGWFKWDDAAVHDGGLVFGKWKRIWDRTKIDIRWFGCKDDDDTDCGAIISQIMSSSLTQYGSSTYGCTTLYVPIARRGWRLRTPIKVPGNGRMRFRVVGEGWFDPGLNRYGPSPSYCSGSVFHVDPGIDGVEAADPYNNIYANLHLQDLAIIGPGTGTQQRGVNAHMPVANFRFTSNKLLTANFATGTYIGNAISAHGHYDLVCNSCLVGLQLGTNVDEPVYHYRPGPTDSEFYSISLEANATGSLIGQCYNIRFFGGLIQGNELGVQLGLSGSGFDNVYFDRFHLESNGREWYFSPDINSADCAFYGCRGGGSMSGSYTIRPYGPTSWKKCANGDATLHATDGIIITLDDMTIKGGFEALNITDHCRFNRGHFIYPSAGSVTSGVISHDWGNDGETWHGLLIGSGTLEAPINANSGAEMTWTIQQDNTGSYDLTIGAGLHLPNYSNTGNGAGKVIVITAKYYGSGIWFEKSCGAWN